MTLLTAEQKFQARTDRVSQLQHAIIDLAKEKMIAPTADRQTITSNERIEAKIDAIIEIMCEWRFDVEEIAAGRRP